MGMNPAVGRIRWLLYVFATLLLPACATPITSPTFNTASGIGPFSSFSGRLIIIEPAHRWQVLVDWDAPTAAQGAVRLTHAASNTVVEFRWQGTAMYMRDSSNKAWRPISTAQLAAYGIVIAPARLADILLGHMPADFHTHGPNTWESKRNGSLIRLHWYANRRRLVMADVRHGRQATLIIQ